MMKKKKWKNGRSKSKKAKVYESEMGYDLYAEVYDENLMYLNSFERQELLRMLGADLDGKEVLDLGMGTGRLAQLLLSRGVKLTGVDISQEMVEKFKSKFSQAEAVKADVRELPFADESFDIALAAFLIVHLRDLEEFFDEVYRVLKPGGFILVTNINQPKAPKLTLKDGSVIVINSIYHRPQNVIKALEECFFHIEEEKFVYEDKVWINQIVKAVKR